jgi:DNA polymerase-1
LKGKQKENVEQYDQQALLSKQLATIDINVPVPFEVEELKCKESDKVVLTELLDELEFRTIRKRLFGEEAVPAAAPAAKSAKKRIYQSFHSN